MTMSRRGILGGGAAFAVIAATQARAMSLLMLGTVTAPKADQIAARDIISRLPTDDYVAIMEALSKLDKTEHLSTSGEPFNRRWRHYANPLLVEIWNSMGYPYRDDCTAWCGVTLGWCLKRAKRALPDDCSSSQSYLNYGIVVKNPAPGDICVFTNQGDSSHGHVTIYRSTLDAANIEVLGANQSLSDPTNCGSGITSNIIDQRSMALSTPRHYLNRYVRPPAHQ